MTDRYLLSPPNVGPEERALLLEGFDSGWIAPVGPQLDQFEAEFAARVGAEEAVALSSGTAALHLGLLLAGVRAGDEVVVPTLTFIASASPARYLGATPVFVDSERATWNIDPGLLEDLLSSRAAEGRLPAAVVVVDVLGQCADHSAIGPVCERFGVPVVEDAAEALGAKHAGRPAGTFGATGAFSFNGNKTVTTSGGGMLVGSSADMARARHLSTQARQPVAWYEHEEVGYNYRLSNLLAALGLAQLRRLDELVAAQRQVNAWYREMLADVDEIEFMPDDPRGEPTNWLTAITIAAHAEVSPTALRHVLDQAGIEARPVWKPMHLQPVFAGCEIVGGDVAADLYGRGLCLPSGTMLTRSDVRTICSHVRDGLRSASRRDPVPQRRPA